MQQPGAQRLGEPLGRGRPQAGQRLRGPRARRSAQRVGVGGEDERRRGGPRCRRIRCPVPSVQGPAGPAVRTPRPRSRAAAGPTYGRRRSPSARSSAGRAGRRRRAPAARSAPSGRRVRTSPATAASRGPAGSARPRRGLEDAVSVRGRVPAGALGRGAPPPRPGRRVEQPLTAAVPGSARGPGRWSPARRCARPRWPPRARRCRRRPAPRTSTSPGGGRPAASAATAHASQATRRPVGRQQRVHRAAARGPRPGRARRRPPARAAAASPGRSPAGSSASRRKPPAPAATARLDGGADLAAERVGVVGDLGDDGRDRPGRDAPSTGRAAGGDGRVEREPRGAPGRALRLNCPSPNNDRLAAHSTQVSS